MSTDKYAQEEGIVTTTCNSHCGGACILRVHVKDGVIKRIETDHGDEPQLRACLRGRAYRQRIYAPERLTHPMKRTGERGKGEFARIPWDEALDTVVLQIKRVRENYGPAGILYLCSVGDLVVLHTAQLMENIFNRLGGSSGVWGGSSAQAALFAEMMTYGMMTSGHSREDVLNSRLIILWGWNPAVCAFHGNTRYHLARARETGVKIIAVDPRYTDSVATYAHQWIYIRPGTDTAMMVAMAYVMIIEKLQDQAFLDKYTVGFDHFKEYVLGKEDGVPKTPVWAEQITGVPVATIASLAREYATSKPAALMAGVAPGRTAYGEQYHRAAITLAAMTGSIGVRGGNAPGAGILGYFPVPPLHMWTSGSLPMKEGNTNPVDREFSPRKNAYWYNRLPHEIFYFGGPSSGRVSRFLLADAILKERQGGYPIDYKMLYMTNINWLNQGPNSNKIAQALKKLEFVVVQEQVMTSTAKYADILLPLNTHMERNDVSEGGFSLFYGHHSKVIDSIGESKSQLEIATDLAARLGISDFNSKTEEEWLREVVEASKDIPDYDEFKKRGYQKMSISKPIITFEEQIRDPENNPFPTRSGKIEIFSQEIADVGDPLLPPIPKYIEAWESRNDPLAKKYPLQLITTHFKRRAHTQFDNVPWLRELEPQTMLISAADAMERGINDGDIVRVFNERGEMVIPARVTRRIMQGVVDVPQGAWYAPDENGVDKGGCANVLTKDEMSPAGAFCSNTALVQVEKA